MYKIAIIGSFKHHFEEVQTVVNIFRSHNIINTTPIGSSIIEPGVDFVRFDDDLTDEPDEVVQTITLKRIFEAGVVYVVAPAGYVGRTTCYEIGRIFQRKMPIYFSSHPKDLPIKLPVTHIIGPEEMVRLIFAKKTVWPYASMRCKYSKLEKEVIEIL
jgi:hypothetical protein